MIAWLLLVAYLTLGAMGVMAVVLGAAWLVGLLEGEDWEA